MIATIIAAGFRDTKIIVGDFAYVFRDHRLVTVVNKWMHDERSKHDTRRNEGKHENRREAHKSIRRHRKRAKADLRRQREDA